MDESAHHHTDRLEDSAEVSDDAPAAPVLDEQRDEVLARAVIDALADGMTWEQIGTRLGVPCPCGHDAVTDREWQDAIVDHENARAQRIQRRPQESPHHHAPKPPVRDDGETSGW